LTPSKKLEPLIKISKQKEVNIIPNILFSMKKSIKKTFVERTEIFSDNKKKITIKNCKKSFFLGFSITNKSERIPKKKIIKKKIFDK
jgi:hypothetical protein